MIQTLKQNGNICYGINEYMIDTKAELSKIPTNIAMGSTVFVIEENKTYVLSGNKEWIEKVSAAAGGDLQETDPTVYAWAKQPKKPKYTAAEVGAVSTENQSFVNAGEFNNLIDLTSYDFNSDKVYKLYVATKITTVDNNSIPVGAYTCTSNVNSANNIWLNLVPIIPSGYYWHISVQEKTGYKVDFVGYNDVNDLYEYIEEELPKKADKTDVVVDIEYNPNSGNAQSGAAVAQATNGLVRERLSQYMPKDVSSLIDDGLNDFVLYSYQMSINLPARVTLDDIKSVIVGDIETALANIKALQESYIGGATE